MDIVFINSKFEKLINNFRKLVKAYGYRNALFIRKRLDDLRAAAVLEDVRHLPGKYHELVGKRKGQLAVHIEQPYRMIFEPFHDPVPLKANNGLDWSAVTCIKIVDIVNYHD
jgi:toxin HigB-1